MVESITVSKNPNFQDPIHIHLEGSKSISNRVLIIQALAGEFDIYHLANAEDTKVLKELLNSNEFTLDAKDGGTTARFLLALLAFSGKHKILTGSDQLRIRPIRPLVDALNTLGGNIQFMENEGFLPLEILPPNPLQLKNTIEVPSNISSQFISALMLVTPSLKEGMTIKMTGETVSNSYIHMTGSIMKYFGVNPQFSEGEITILPQKYARKSIEIEADWSAAAFWYGWVALGGASEIRILGLFEDSVQGDSVLPILFSKLGVSSTWNENGLSLRKIESFPHPSLFEWDFRDCPDLAQPVSVVCAGLGITGLFSGLETLSLKETDRILALKTELEKVRVTFYGLPPRFSKSGKKHWMQEGKAESNIKMDFSTYGDHRMAMSFSLLGAIFPVEIIEPKVVKKSYVSFWNDLEKAGGLLNKTLDI
jgi:3-phosphoshikimate 1-carboxyvinyltransferase